MTLTERVRERFLASPDTWLDGHAFASIGGYAGWSARIRDLRKPPYLMTIENRVRRCEQEGRKWTVTEYRWVTGATVERPLLTIAEQGV